MVPLILLFSVALVGLLSIFVLGSVARKHIVGWRHERARLAARAAKLAESARLKAEHAASLARLNATAPRAPVRAHAPSVGLTSLFATLEDSGLFTPQAPAAPLPRSRLAKGSVPMPMQRTPATAALGPYSTVGSLTPGANVRPVPPPIPRRAIGSVPPPIPSRRPPRHG